MAVMKKRERERSWVAMRMCCDNFRKGCAFFIALNVKGRALNVNSRAFFLIAALAADLFVRV